MARSTKNSAPPLIEEVLPTLTLLDIPAAVAVPFGTEARLHAVGIKAVTGGLKVFVEPYVRMQTGDLIEVFWNGSAMPSASAVVDTVDMRVGLNIPESQIQAGRVSPYYHITAPSGANSDSPSSDIWVKLDIPGGANPELGKQENRNLAAPIVPPDVAQSGVNKTRAQSGVEITIPPYPNMAEYDRIEFWWGGQRNWVLVQPGNVGQPVRFTVNEQTILTAGDGEIVLHYQLIDAALNFSDGWSLPTKVMVTASNSILAAPLVAEAVDGVVDLAVLAGRDVTVQVLALSSPFAVGETIEVLWAGRDAGGNAVNYSATRNLQNVPQVVQFSVPNAKVAAIAQGAAVVSYTLRKPDGTSFSSLSTQVRIKGQAVSLAAPVVIQANAGQLAYDLPSATVRIAPYASMAAGNEVTLIWAGQRTNGQPTYYTSSVIVTQNTVGHDVLFDVPGTEIAALTGGSVEVYYQVKATLVSEVPAQQSAHLQLQVTGNVTLFPAPTVLQADGDRLDPGVSYADVRIPAYPGISIGDDVQLLWIGDLTSLYSDRRPVATSSEQLSGLQFRVYAEEILGNLDHYITVSYSVIRNGRQVGKSVSLRLRVGAAQVVLPAPRVDQAQGNILITADVPASGATVRIPAAARLIAGDTGTVHWRGQSGAGTIDVPFTVSLTDQDAIVTVPQAVVVANNGFTVTLDYTVTRAGSLMTSYSTSYEIRASSRTGRLLVMGARSRTGKAEGRSGIPYLIGQNWLTALDVYTQRPIEALWRYTDETKVQTASRFLDTRPTAILEVQALGDRVQIRPRNVTGNGQVELGAFVAQRDKGLLVAWGEAMEGGIIPNNSIVPGLTDVIEIVPNDRSFAALRSTGQVVAWGNADNGGSISTNEISSLNDIVEVVASRYAYAARRRTGQVVAWGNPAYGGSIPINFSGINDVTGIVANWQAFAALHSTGRVTVWGNSAYGGSIPIDSGISSLTNISDIIANAYAFAARQTTGKVVAWGAADLGGNIPATSGISGLTDIISVVASSRAFAARRSGGQVVAWGDVGAGGNIPAHSGISTFDDVVNVVPNDWAFAALRNTGQVVAWGDTTRGGDIPANSGISGLNDIVEVTANAQAFAARRRTGQIVVWGESNNGGSFPISSPIPNLTDIVQVVASSYAFAALRSNGTVVAWGNGSSGGIIPTDIARQLTNVRAIYASHMAFIALTDNNCVIAWGSSATGGNNAAIPPSLQGNISYEISSGI